MSSNYCFNVTIYRDSLSTPWGFRLEGGKDYQSPLTIQRVFQGSPASGYLQRGDVILNIQNRDATQLYHQEANEIIRKAGGSLQITVKRGQAYPGSDGAAYNATHSFSYITQPKTTVTTYTTHHFNSAASAPKVLTQRFTTTSTSGANNNYYDHTYDHSNAKPYDPDDPSSLVRNRVIEKTHDPKPILSQTGSPILPGQGQSNTKTSVALRRYQSSKTLPSLPRSFQHAAPAPVANVPAPSSPPYHEREMIDKITSSLSRIASHRPRQSSVSPNYYPSTSNIYQQVVYNEPEPVVHGSMHVHDKVAQIQHHNNKQQQQQQLKRQTIHGPSFNFTPSYQPPWVGTLKSSNKQYRPVSTKEIEFGNIGPLKIVNAQYNTPLGLYSNRNINEELNKQVGGKVVASRHQSQSGYELPASDF